MMTPTASGRDGEVLSHGELTVIGRIRSASNATFLCEAAQLDDWQVHCVQGPCAGRGAAVGLPDGTLAGRELSAYSGLCRARLECRASHHHP